MNVRTILTKHRSLLTRSLITSSNNNRCVMITQLRYKRDIPNDGAMDREVKNTIDGTNESTIPEFPVWNETLASASEATVKAELSPNKSFLELQQETIDVIKKKETMHQYPMQ